MIKRFKLKTSIALIRIETTIYKLNDIRKEILARQYATNILRLIRFAEIEFVKDRLTCIYMSFVYKLKRDLRVSTNNITIDEYFNILNELQEVWEARAHPSRKRSIYHLKKPREELLYQILYQYKSSYYNFNKPSLSRLP